MPEPETLDRPKLHKDAAFVDQQTKRTPVSKTAAPTLGSLRNLTPAAERLRRQYVAEQSAIKTGKSLGVATSAAETARLKLVGVLAQPDYIPKWQKESKSVIAEKKHIFETSRNLEDRVYGENLDPSLLPEQKLEDMKEASEHWDKTTGAALKEVEYANTRAFQLRLLSEVQDLDAAAKAKLADPRHVAEMARVRVAEQFEKKRLLNSFRKPSNPIMMISGGSAIYRGGVSEEDQIDMLEEQTFRHLAKRKRLGMPLMD